MTGVDRLHAFAAMMPDGARYELLHIANQIERETLPRPMFEDGTPVQFGDAVCCDDGYTFTVDAIEVMRDGWFSLSQFSCSVSMTIQPGERVKRPEQQDTWERIEADAHKEPCDYFGAKESRDCWEAACSAADVDVPCLELMGVDLVRRCKALAGVE